MSFQMQNLAFLQFSDHTRQFSNQLKGLYKKQLVTILNIEDDSQPVQGQ